MADRRTYIDKMAAQLKEWDDDIRELEIKAQQRKADSKAEYEKRLAELKKKRNDAQTKLEDLKKSGDASWEELKKGADKIFDDAKTTLKNIKAKF